MLNFSSVQIRVPAPWWVCFFYEFFGSLFILLEVSLLNYRGMSAFLFPYNPVSMAVIIDGFSFLTNLSRSSVLFMLPDVAGTPLMLCIIILTTALFLFSGICCGYYYMFYMVYVVLLPPFPRAFMYSSVFLFRIVERVVSVHSPCCL